MLRAPGIDDCYLISNDSTDERVEEDGIVVACRIDRLSSLKLIVDTEGEVGSVDGDVYLLPLRIVQVFADDDSLVLRNQVRMKVQSSVP